MAVMGVGAALATLVSLPAARTEGLSSPIATVLQLVGLLAQDCPEHRQFAAGQDRCTHPG